MKEGIYSLEVSHTRRKPVEQRFAVSGYCLFVNVARFDIVRQSPALLGFGKWRVHNFVRSDFSLLENESLSAVDCALTHLRAVSGEVADEVFLLANPRIAGYVFNPVSFFFCYRNGTHVATIVEVNNTFSQQKHYVVPAGAQVNTQKKFYVSPFISPFSDFNMRINAPDDSLSIGIHTQTQGRAELVAEMRGARKSLTDFQLLVMFLKYPFYTLRIIIMIHWYAVRLLLLKVPFYPKENSDAAILHANLRSEK